MFPYFIICRGYFNLSTKSKAIVIGIFTAINVISWNIFVIILGWT